MKKTSRKLRRIRINKRIKSSRINFRRKTKINNPKRQPLTLPKNKSLSWLKNHVLQYQMKLAVAIRNKDWQNAFRINKQIISSKWCQYFAVYRTISAKGSRTMGIRDTERPTKQIQYDEMRAKLWETVKNPPKYNCSPLKRFNIPKPNSTETRPLSVPSYIDRAVQHLFLISLDVFQEESADKNSFGFRKFRSPGWAAKTLTLQIWGYNKKKPPENVIELDIRKCYDSINHDFIINMVCNYRGYSIIPKPILQKWLECGYIDPKINIKKTFPTPKGLPQGGPISPTLANMVLNGIENAIQGKINPDHSHTETPKVLHTISRKDKVVWTYKGTEILCSFNLGEGDETIHINETLRNMGYKLPLKGFAKQLLRGKCGMRTRANWSIRWVYQDTSLDKPENTVKILRFADDMVVLVENKSFTPSVIQAVQEFLSKRGLELNLEKTHTKEVAKNERIRFVGFEFATTLNHGKWKIHNYPPRDKIKNLKGKISECILKHQRSPYTVFYRVNAITRGWCNFYSCANSKQTFSNISNWLWHRFQKYFRNLLLKSKHRGKYLRKNKTIRKRALIGAIKNYFQRPLSFSTTKAKWWSVDGSRTPIGRK